MIVNHRIIVVGVLILLICLMSGLIQAQDKPSQRVLSLDLLTEAAMAAIKECEKSRFKVSVAIVDRSGLVRVQLKAEGAGPHTLDSSRRKAYTANSLRAPTQKFAVLTANTPELRGLANMNGHILLLGGGFPININGETVGGIGVGGAPGIKFDEVCASAALDVLNADDKFRE